MEDTFQERGSTNSEEENFKNRLQSMEFNDFVWFLAQEFHVYENQHNLSQGTVDTLIETFANFANEWAAEHAQHNSEEEDQVQIQGELDKLRAHFYVKFANLLMPGSREGEQESIYEQIVKNLTANINSSQGLATALDFFKSWLGASIWMIRQEDLFDFLAEVYWQYPYDLAEPDQNRLESLKNGIESNLIYSANFGAESFAQNFRKAAADSFDKENPGKIIKMLELARQIGMQAPFVGYDTEAGSYGIQRAVQEVAEMTDNFLVQQMASSVLQQLEASAYPDKVAQSDQEFNEVFDDFLPEDGSHSYDGRDKAKIIHDQGFIVAPLSPGLVGYYDENGQPVGASLRTELAKEGEQLRIYQPSKLPLFADGQNLGAQSKNTQLKESLVMFSLPVRELLSEKMDIGLEHVPLPSQAQFYRFCKHSTVAEVEEMTGYAHTFGVPFFDSFVSMQEGNERSSGEKILNICRTYPEGTVALVLNKYRELLMVSEKAGAYVAENILKESKEDLAHQIAVGLLGQGRAVLDRAASGKVSEDDLLKQLDRTKADLLLFANAFRNGYGKDDASVEQFKELSIEHVPGGQLNPEDRQEMLLMADQNWDELRKQMPEMYDQIMQDISFQLDGKNPKDGTPLNTVWHIMKRGKTVLGFFRLDEETSDTVYFGSMNSLLELHGFKLGDAILREMLDKETAGKLTRAHASPKTAICRSYINKYGFEGTGFLDYYKTGERLLAIEKDNRPTARGEYILRGKSFAGLEAMKGQPGIQIADYEFPDDFKGEEYERFLAETQDRFDQGKVLSAYVAGDTVRVDPDTNRKIVSYRLGFEPKEPLPKPEPSPN